jgi:DNA-directed RNA polymerase I, II, and III subunit RPABC2
MDEDFGDSGYGGAEPEDIQDDMDVDGGTREDLDHEAGVEDRVELLTEAPAQPIDKSKRITTRYMTKYERARVLGTRALQIR